MEEKLQEFKDYWNDHWGFISLDLEDWQIIEFIEKAHNSIVQACDRASDFLLASGNADVQE